MYLADIKEYVDQHGLIMRGGFTVCESDQLPALSNGKQAISVVIIGNAGSAMWRQFVQSDEYKDGRLNPLDRWTRAVMSSVARTVGADVLFPFDGPPWWPFQRWCARCESMADSPLGIIIHPEYGLWHALRAAFLFDQPLPNRPPFSAQESACHRCIDKPCLRRCPVGAYTAKGFNPTVCVSYLKESAECLTAGCLARNVCPEGEAYTYDVAEHVFHLQAFYNNHN